MFYTYIYTVFPLHTHIICSTFIFTQVQMNLNTFTLTWSVSKFQYNIYTYIKWKP